jgi:hypothetical protein
MKLRLLITTALLSFGQFGFGQDTFTYSDIKTTSNEETTHELVGGDGEKTSQSRSLNNSTNSGIGETPGVLSVSLTGGALYDIPIMVPPGINGVKPAISLSYDSQSSLGSAGYGWNIAGISKITRISSTEYYDGSIDGIDFDNQDRFALDGQRLILKSGTYGGNGAVYETEKYSNLKIVSYGTSPYGSSYGPSYFVVFYPDGSKAYFGYDIDSRSRLAFSISYWINPQGLKIDYEYETSGNTLYIEKIKYGGRNSTPGMNEIIFNHYSRDVGGDTNDSRFDLSYYNDIQFRRENLLSSIEVWSEGIEYKSYDLSHSVTNLRYPY